MARSVPRPATFEDLERVPDNMVGEILDGELVVSPRPALRHALAASSLGGDLMNPFQKGRGGPGGWWILDEPELHLGRDALVPDLGGWRKERLPVFPDAAAMTLAPDWVCEVISPSTGRIDRVRKLPIYARERVEHVWIIDPTLRTLEVFHREGAKWLLHQTASHDDIVRAAPFDAIEIDLMALWGETRPAP